MIALYVLAAIFAAVAGVLILHFLFLFVLSIFAKNRDYDKPNGFYRSVFLYHIKLAIFMSNVKIAVSGVDKLDGIKGKYLIVANHRSNYDPFIIVHALKDKETAFISKPENFKVPFFGKIARRAGYTAIDRDNPRNAINTINRTAELMKKGVISFGVCPEGTRSKSVNMLPFHDGVFKIAQKAQSPVVVIGLRGTEKVHKRAPFKRTVVYMDVLEVISAEKVRELSSHELADIAREKLSITEGR